MSKNKPQKRRAHQPHGQGNSQTAGYGASASAGSGSAATATHSPTRTRGALITAVIVFIILHGALFALLAWSDLKGEEARSSYYMPILMITSVLDVIAGVALWFWKRWGFQLYVGATLVMATSALMNTGSFLVLFASILPTIVIAYMFLPKQKYFD